MFYETVIFKLGLRVMKCSGSSCPVPWWLLVLYGEPCALTDKVLPMRWLHGRTANEERGTITSRTIISGTDSGGRILVSGTRFGDGL